MAAQGAMVLRINEDAERQELDGEERAHLSVVISEMISMGEVQQIQIARETSLSPAAVSTWLKGEYKGDNNAVEEKISIWLAAWKRKNAAADLAPTLPQWVATPTAQKIIGALAYAQIAGDITVIYGGAGLGKTCSHEEYQRKNPNVWLVTMAPDTAGIFAALEEIAETIGLRGIPGRASRLRRELVKKFRGSAGLLIIDEAQHLSVEALESIRAIHDATGIGLALSGNEKVYTNLFGGGKMATFAQLHSRVGRRLRLTRTSRNDAAAMLDAGGIKGKQEREMLIEIALKGRALRGMVKVWNLAMMSSKGCAEPFNVKHIKSAWNDTGGIE